MLTSTDKDDGGVSGSNGGNGTTTSGSTIGLCDDNGTKIGSLLESSGLGFSSLTDRRIENHNGLVRRNGVLDLYHLIEKVLLLPVTTRSIDDDDLELFLLELVDTLLCDLDGIGLGQATVVWDLCFDSILLELIEGTGTESIGANQGSLEASGLVPAGELGTSGGFTGTLQTNEHDDIGLALLGVVWLGMRIHELDEFVVDSLRCISINLW